MKRPVNASMIAPSEISEALAILGWKQTDFARRTGITPATVNAWINGRAPAPPWAAAYLGAMLDLNALYRKYLAPLPASRDAPEGPADAPARLAHLLPGATPPAG